MQNAITFSGLIPAKLSENILPIVPAGFANDVEEVNQYAAPIYEATTSATFSLLEINIKNTNPKVAIISEIKILDPTRALSENSIISCPNIMFAIKTPIIDPAICKITKLTKVLNDISLFKKIHKKLLDWSDY